MYDTLLFIDFDGTVTTEETLSGAMQRCIDPALYRATEQRLLKGELTLADTLHYAFEHIASSRLPEIMDYVRSVPLRAGLTDLLDGMQAAGVPVVIISGGLTPYVEEILAPCKDKLLAIHSVDLDTAGEYMRLVSAYEAGGEIIDKTRVMAQYEYRRAACVGDGMTDMRMALHSDIVFARDMLADMLQRKGKPFHPWNDFYDILKGMKAELNK